MTDQFSSSCTGQEETIYLFLDNELPPAERGTFLTHLAGCPACQAMLAEIEAFYADLTDLESLQSNSQAINEIMTRLPQPEKPSFAWTGYLLLTGQVVIGLSLLILSLPRLLAPYQVDLSTTGYTNFTFVWQAITGWGQSAFQTSEIWFQSQWTQLLTITSLKISPSVAFSLLLVGGLVWLVGNGLLFNDRIGSFKNGRSL